MVPRLKASTSRLLQWCALMGSVAASLMMYQIVLIHGARAAFMVDVQFYALPATLLGIGAGGVLTYFFRVMSSRAMIFCAILASVSFIALAFAYSYQSLGLGVFLLSSFLAYAMGGWVVSSILTDQSDNIPLLLCVDLIAAGLGALLAVIALNMLGYTGAALICVVIIFLIAILSQSRFRIVSLIGLLAIVSLLLPHDRLRLLFGVTCPVVDYPVLYGSNTIAELAVMPRPLSNVHDLGSRAQQGATKSYLILMNCTSGATMALSAALGEQEFLKDDLRAIPLAWIKETRGEVGDVLVPSAGAGIDVMRALLFEPRSVLATEFNPEVVRLSSLLSHPDTYPYDQEKVTLFVGDTRRLLLQDNRHYDLILHYLSSRFGSLSGVADTPNYSVSVEMLAELYAHLSEDGVLAMVGPPGDSVLFGVTQMMMKNGLDPQEYVVYIAGRGKEDVSLVSKQPLQSSEIEVLKRIARERGFAPSTPGDEGYPQVQTGPGGVTNDRPYAYYKSTDARYFSPENIAARGKQALIAGFAAFLAICAFVLTRSRTSTPAAAMLIITAAAVGSALGLGFIIFELWAIQRMFLALADPSISFAVTVAAITIGGGLGSLSLRFIPKKSVPWYVGICGILLISFCAFGYPSDDYLVGLSGLQLFERVMSVSIYLSVPAFLLGIFLPATLVFVSPFPRLVPLVWALDGVFAVVGGLVAQAYFHTQGLSSAFGVVGSVYALATLLIAILFLISRENSIDGYHS